MSLVSAATDFLSACHSGDSDRVSKSLEEDTSSLLLSICDEHGRSPLHYAAAAGHVDIIRILLQAGHQWNILDNYQKSVGECAKENGHEDAYKVLVDHGVQVELLLNALEARGGVDDAHLSREYLSDRLEYTKNEADEVLVDSKGDAVMMGWETELMRLHAERLCSSEGLSVLNVGFGLGIVDGFFQKHKPKKHTIIEAHPDVYAKIARDGWLEKEGVEVLFGTWQKEVGSLLAKGEQFDVIYFDTFAESFKDLKDFVENVLDLLKMNGQFSYFNGLAATNPFFHDVYCSLCALEFRQMGLDVSFEAIRMDALGDDVWDGVRQKYWTLDTYYLPKCVFLSD